MSRILGAPGAEPGSSPPRRRGTGGRVPAEAATPPRWRRPASRSRGGPRSAGIPVRPPGRVPATRLKRPALRSDDVDPASESAAPESAAATVFAKRGSWRVLRGSGGKPDERRVERAITCSACTSSRRRLVRGRRALSRSAFPRRSAPGPPVGNHRPLDRVGNARAPRAWLHRAARASSPTSAPRDRSAAGPAGRRRHAPRRRAVGPEQARPSERWRLEAYGMTGSAR
jgi:hypothetical protein